MAENDIDYFIEKVRHNAMKFQRSTSFVKMRSGRLGGPTAGVTADSHRSATRTTSRNCNAASTPAP